MTRENKLALVMGFGLILFVGILVSDHFSLARNQQSADLLPAGDPTAPGRREDPELLHFASADDPGGASMQPVLTSFTTTAAPIVRDPAAGNALSIVQMPDLQQQSAQQQLLEQYPGLLVPANQDPALPRVSLPADQARQLPYTIHEVQPGETLTSVARRHYGDASLLRELAAFNGLDDPDHVTTGQRLRIPAANTLVRGGGTAASTTLTAAAPPPPAAPAPRNYTVQPGDVLTTIAQKVLGSSKRWRELWEHNKDVLGDPDHVEVGMVLKVPGNRQ